MTGLWPCLRVLVRTSWLSLIGWPLALSALLWTAASSILTMYPDAAHRAAYAQSVTSSAATRVFQGRGYDLTTSGGIFAQEMAILTLTLFPVVGAHLAIRMTRSLEDNNYLDVLTAGIIGRRVPVVAGTLACGLSAVLTGGAGAAILIGAGYPTHGTLWYALSLTLLVAWAAALGLLAGQLFRNAREAHFLAIGLILGCYLLRGWIDVESAAATWSNPISWLAECRPFADSRPWWPYLAYLATIVVLCAVAFTVTNRRDLGGGVFAPRSGAAGAGRALAGPATLLLRLTRGSGIALLVGGGVTALVFGLFAEQMASSGLDDRLILLMQVNALFASAAGALSVQTAMREESAGRTGRVLSEPIGRGRWLGSAALVAAVWSIGMLALTGALSGAGLAISLHDGGRVAEALGDTFAYAPAVCFIIALTCLLGALRPVLASIAWLIVAWSAVVTLRADMLRLSEPVRRFSPLEWMGKLPVEAWEWRAGLVMVAIAGVALVLSLAFFSRRDLAKG